MLLQYIVLWWDTILCNYRPQNRGMFHKPIQKFYSELLSCLSFCTYSTVQVHTNQQQALHIFHLWALVLQASESFCSSMSYRTSHRDPHLSQQALPTCTRARGSFGPVLEWVWLVHNFWMPVESSQTAFVWMFMPSVPNFGHCSLLKVGFEIFTWNS